MKLDKYTVSIRVVFVFAIVLIIGLAFYNSIGEAESNNLEKSEECNTCENRYQCPKRAI